MLIALLVVSSSNEDPAAAFTELYQQQKRMESLPYPKWLTPHVYCWHILLHDVVAGNAKRSVTTLGVDNIMVNSQL